MIFAEQKGKLPEVQNKEDVLTSNVFGLLKLLDSRYVLKIFGQAKNLEGKELSEKVERYADLTVRGKEFIFWPRIKGGEPDILLQLVGPSGKRIPLIVEIKYESAESGEGQLLKYFSSFDEEEKYLIYVTKSMALPQEIREYNNENFFWINWTKINEILKSIIEADDIPSDLEIRFICLIVEYLNHKGFLHFSGWNSLAKRCLIQGQVRWFYQNYWESQKRERGVYNACRDGKLFYLA